MKVFLPMVTLCFYLFLTSIVTDYVKMDWLQTYQGSTDGNITYWSSIEIEGIQVAATYNTPVFVFKKSWAKGKESDDYWSTFNIFLNKYFSAFILKLNEIRKNYGITGVFTVQCFLRCTTIFNDTEGFTYRLAKEGQSVVHLNLTTRMWEAENSQPLAKAAQKILQEDADIMKQIANNLQNLCQELAQIFSSSVKEAFSKKFQPQVFITSQSSGTEVMCMATGFYPRPINVSLWKENKMADMMLTETLPNGDDTYQITVLTNIDSTKQQWVYCRVEHSSLKEPIIVYLEKKHHTSNGLFIGISVVIVVAVVGLAYLVVKLRKRRYDSIIGTTMDRLSWRKTHGDGLGPSTDWDQTQIFCNGEQSLGSCTHLPHS
ncbi:antigen-presenting glycoprotein CD1d-like isoform X2 [Pyxicephalus adspersus]|uniref:antigen-presenting glycoprotein CD1d-like isoform X2 n=1 Tax=Pyxicephalus adspersus TaxID=30357 RepID=UPI003B5BF776